MKYYTYTCPTNTRNQSHLGWLRYAFDHSLEAVHVALSAGLVAEEIGHSQQKNINSLSIHQIQGEKFSWVISLARSPPCRRLRTCTLVGR
jgi:hypothetical protein